VPRRARAAVAVQEIEALLDTHAARFADPQAEQVSRHARERAGERVAFFEVVPKAAGKQASFTRAIWTNFLGQI
jgi:hypothetical protein